MKGVPLVQPRPLLPVGEDLLRPTLREPPALGREEQRRLRGQILAPSTLPHDELPQLRLEPPGQEDVACAAALGHTEGIKTLGLASLQAQDCIEEAQIEQHCDYSLGGLLQE